MPEYVRVTDLDTGHKLSVLKSEVPHGNYRELKADAVNELGDPLAPEYHAVKPTSTGATPATDTTKE